MTVLDYGVLVGYFLMMAALGLIAMLKVKDQEDFFLGGRAFGRLLQAFAAFGAGTGSNDPVTLGSTIYRSGLSGIWGVLNWLFVTPFYWIFGIWYRRMRHLTLGDWFVERYESRSLGAAYTLFAIVFYMVYLSVGFSAIGKVCTPLLATTVFQLPGIGTSPVEAVLVPVIALIVLIYGALGGLRAAYWTDLIQGIFIIVLSIILIPYGLQALVDKFGDPTTDGTLAGFRIMHEQVPKEYFQIADSPIGGDFPLHYIIAITIINMVGIVVQPHFIATGGGSAKTENSARVGLVAGNFMKRFCTVGWALTGLIVLALLAENIEIAEDPDRAWGVAAREILGPLNLGLVGLMLACMLAALMSSADCYMLVTSGLVVRNVYAAYINPNGTEKEYVFAGRMVSFIVIVGAVIISLMMMNVFGQLKWTFELPMIFAAPFWIGMFWRRATRLAAWLTVAFSATVFFILPSLLPVIYSDLTTHPSFTQTNAVQTTIIERKATPADVDKRKAAIAVWEEAAAISDPQLRSEKLQRLGEKPEPITAGDTIKDIYKTGGKPIFWTSIQPLEGTKLKEVSRTQEGNIVTIVETYDGPVAGSGYFNLDFLLYEMAGLDLTQLSSPMLETLRLPPKVITPFIVMVLLSLTTRPNRKEALDRYFVKMKTPVEPDHERDLEELEKSYQNPTRYDHNKLFPNSNLEFQRPDFADIAGFIISFLICFGIIGLTVWIAQIGA